MSRRRDRSDEEDTLFERGSLLIAVILFGVSWVASALLPENIKADAMFSAAFAILAYICGIQYTRARRFDRIDDSLEKLRASQAEILAYDRTKNKVVQRLLGLFGSDQVLRLTGFHAIETALSGSSIKTDEKFIAVSGKSLTFSSYQHFWERLLELQRRKGRRTRRIARLTHSGNVATWSSDQSDSLRAVTQIHEDFTAAGGVVFRLFLANSDTGAVADYIGTMTVMARAGVICAYMHQKDVPSILASDFAADFCIIEPDNYSSDWRVDAKSVASCEIGNRDDKYIQNLRSWQRLVDELALNCTYEESQGLTSKQVAFFREKRMKFLERLRQLPRGSRIALPEAAADVLPDQAV